MKQLEDYEEAVMQKRLAEMPQEDVERLMAEVQDSAFPRRSRSGCMWSLRQHQRGPHVRFEGASAEGGQHGGAAAPWRLREVLCSWSLGRKPQRHALCAQVEEEGPIRADKRRRFLEAQQRGEAPKL